MHTTCNVSNIDDRLHKKDTYFVGVNAVDRDCINGLKVISTTEERYQR